MDVKLDQVQDKLEEEVDSSQLDDSAMDDDYDEDEAEIVPPEASVEEMRIYLFTREAMFLDALPDGVDEVDLDAKTEEIAQLLQEQEDLEATFSSLTDQVEYKDFWQRYFYRLDESQLKESYEHYYILEQQAQRDADRAAFKAGGGALTSVTNFLGGAVKRIIDESDNAAKQPAAGTGAGAIGFLTGTGGRPPFVMNTAVSEDDSEEEEDEEELGWDDEDDDDEDGDEDDADGGAPESDSDDQEGQIEFKDAEKEKLQTDLEQAVSERDMLHNTIEMQAEEIKRLKNGVASGDESKQVEALKMQIFEKDSELAALRARVAEDEETPAEKTGTGPSQAEAQLETLKLQISDQNVEIERLKDEISLKNKQLGAAKDTSAAGASELEEKLQAMLTTSESDKRALEAAESDKGMVMEELAAIKEAMAQLEAENASLKRAQESSGDAVQAQLAEAQEGLLHAQSQVSELQGKCKTLEMDLSASQVQVTKLEQMLSSSQSAFEIKEQELSAAQSKLRSAQSKATSANSQLQAAEIEVNRLKEQVSKLSLSGPSSPGSNSTGVKVSSPPSGGVIPTPPEPEVPKVEAAVEDNDGDNNDDDDSDWGDW